MSQWFFIRNGDTHDNTPIETMGEVSIYSRDWNNGAEEFTRQDAIDYLTQDGGQGGYIHHADGTAAQFVAPKPK